MPSSTLFSNVTHFRRVFLAALLTLLVADGLTAQTLRGRIADGRTQEPMADVIVSLLDEDANVLTQSTSGPSGAFSLAAPGPGEYYVQAEKLSYTTVTDGIFVFETAQAEMAIALFMLPRPTEIAGIDVIVEREQVRRLLRQQGYYDRAAQGFGRFIGPQELARRPAFNFGDILRGIPGVRYSPDGEILFQQLGVGASTCQPTVFIDGTRIFADGGIQWLIQPEDVEAVEVYRRVSEIPLEWGGLNSCGVILVWTKG